jgi:hypothetical protein
MYIQMAMKEKIPEGPNEVINKDEETRNIWKG